MMHRNFLLSFVIGITLWSVVAVADEQAAQRLRQEAEASLEAGNPVAAQMALERAHASARTIGDAYGQANALRYVGELYIRMDNQKAADAVFSDAMTVALGAEPWYRKLSAVIAVVEMQHRLKEYTGVRKHGLKAIEAGLLEEIDAVRRTGEVRRFFAAMDGALLPGDVEAVLQRVRRISHPPLRRKVLYSLHVMEWGSQ